MVNLANLNFNRLIMHQVFCKEDGQPHATVEPANNIFNIDEDANDILRDRLSNAAGKNSKAFELEIGNSSPNTFYSIANTIKGNTNPDFISKSISIANLLAASQTSSNMPGGYLLVIEAQEREDNRYVLIVIKAELHEAFRTEMQQGVSVLKVLKDVFLSPSQKLYKIGILYEKLNPVGSTPNDIYGCFLFDDQFRKSTKPAEYFYKDFLGFDISNNAKIQSQLFYEQTFNFIKENISETNKKMCLINELRNLFSVNQDTIITPAEFSTTYFETPALRDIYSNEVLVNFHASIVKDSTLIDYELNHKKLVFPNKIKVSGPEIDFDLSVSLINSKDLFDSLDHEAKDYTILKITGQPFFND